MTGQRRPPDVLYHYCSNEAFLAILESRKVWLSSLRLSSDTAEGEVLLNALWSAAQQSGEKVLGHLRTAFANYARRQDELGFCLSEAGDLLSQWRGYGDDGSGVAIGFSSQWLESVAGNTLVSDPVSPEWSPPKAGAASLARVQLCPITYEESEEAKGFEDLIRRVVWAASQEVVEPTSEGERAVQMTYRTYGGPLSPLKADLGKHRYRFKSKGFREEKEWRLLAELRDYRGCRYRARGAKIVPYLELELRPFARPLEEPFAGAIARIVLGPANETPEEVVRKMLQLREFSTSSFAVAIDRSAASYRPV